MVRLEETAETFELEQRTNATRYIAIFFVAVTALDVIATISSLVKGAGAGALIGPTLGGVFATLIFGYAPSVRLLKVSKATNEATYEQSSLFKKRTTTFVLSDVRRVAVFVGVYMKFVDIMLNDGGPLSVLSGWKSWTWQTTAGAEMLGRAQKLAAFLGTTLDAPAS